MPATAFPYNPAPEMSRIFVDGFYEWLRYFSKDKAKLTTAFAHMFDLSCFFIAADEAGQILAIAACTDGKASSVHLNKAELIRGLGFFRGRFAARVLKAQFEEHPYPFPLTPDTGSLEFVAVTPAARGQGLAAALLTCIMDRSNYSSWVLEVADTNEPAVRLYERLGFRECKRVSAPRGSSGINFLVYMKKEGNNDR